MKNFTFLAAALVFSLSANAGIHQLHNTPTRIEAKLNHNTKFEFKTENRKQLKKATPLSIEVSENIIDEAPEGVLSSWSRSCTGWYIFYGYLAYEEVVGSAITICEGTDGSYYLNGGVSEFPLSTWYKADKDADGNLVIPSGQIVYKETYEGDDYLYGLCGLTYEIDDEGYLNDTVLDKLVLTYENGEYKTAEGEMLALCEYDPSENEWYWVGFGDEDIVLSAVTSTLPEVPSTVEFEKWSAFAGETGWLVSVGIDGNKIYVKDIDSDVSGSVAIGEISADGTTVTFAEGQYLGVSDYGFYTFLYGGELEETYDEYWDYYDTTPVVKGALVCSYDAAQKKLVAQNTYITACNYTENYDEAVATNYYESLEIVYQQRDPNAKPANPTDLMFYDEYDYYGSNTFEFVIPNVDVNGVLLDSSNLYYRMYVDGDVFTFYGDEYVGMPEEGTELVQADFTNYNDIYSSGTSKSIWLYFQGNESIGVQSVYMQPVEDGDPIELESDIITTDCSSVKNIVAENAQIANSVYYDLQGRKVTNPSTGLYIRRDTLTDGTIKAVKVAVK